MTRKVGDLPTASGMPLPMEVGDFSSFGSV